MKKKELEEIIDLLQIDRKALMDLLSKYRDPPRDKEFTPLIKSNWPYSFRPSAYRFFILFSRKKDRDYMEKLFRQNRLHCVSLERGLP